MPISPSNIYSDFQQLLANNSNDPLDIFQPPPQNDSGDFEQRVENPERSRRVEEQTLSAVSTYTIYADFQKLLQGHPSHALAKEGKRSLDEFANWLRQQKLSNVSIKNYLSDVRQFFIFTQKTNSANPLFAKDEDQGSIFSKLVEQYLHNLHAPRATTNRKLASLRKYCLFINQTLSIPNLPNDHTYQLLKSFKAYLVKTRHRPKTITNYLSDLRHYLKWAKEHSHSVVTDSHLIVTHSKQRMTTSDTPQSGASDHE